MDSHAPPKEQPAALRDGEREADRCGQRGQQRRSVLDLDDPVAALALLRFLGTLELDEVRFPGSLLAELESAASDIEVGVPLPDRASVFCSELPTRLDGVRRGGASRLQLDVAPGAHAASSSVAGIPLRLSAASPH
jgi:hypothetical protein